jgi:hypothetical protein
MMHGLWLPARRPEPLYPNEVFFDDTGANAKFEQVFMWCGYLANMLYWVEFAEKWRTALAEKPSLPFWHQARARAKVRKPPFDKLSDGEIRAKEEDLAKILGAMGRSGEHRCVAIVTRLPRVYYDQYVRGKIIYGRNMVEEHREKFRAIAVEREHTIALKFSAIAAFVIVKQWGIGSPVNYIYDEQKDAPYQVEALEAHKVLKTSFPGHDYLVGPLRFEPGENVPGLQAADMLAWHMGQRSRRKPEGDDVMWKHIETTPINEAKIGIKGLTDYVEMYNSMQLRYEELFAAEIAARPKEGTGKRTRKKKK